MYSSGPPLECGFSLRLFSGPVLPLCGGAPLAEAWGQKALVCWGWHDSTHVMHTWRGVDRLPWDFYKVSF